MLTSQHYLHPEYLQPLPTTLDAKKSPLALLAQTCSSIGKDTTPSKPIIPPIEKDKKEGHNNNNSRSPSSPSIKPEDKARSIPSHSDKRDGGSSPGSDSGKGSYRNPTAPKDIPPLVPIGSSGSKSPSVENRDSKSSPSGDRERDTNSVSSASASSSGPSAGIQSNSKISLSCGNMLLEVNHSESASAVGLPARSSAPTTTTSSSSSILTPGSKESSLYSGALPPSLAGYPGCGGLSMMGHHHLTGESGVSPLHPSALHSHALAAAKHGSLGTPLPGTAAISPYSYARVKTAAGATTLVPICRDPYCTNCQLTMQGQLSSPCPSGCTQCTHDKTLPASSLAGHAGLGSSLPVLYPSMAGATAASASSYPLPSSLYPHAFGILPSHHSLPYVCNWVAGSDYCGKRFTTSEELLQHLRTHTSSSDNLASLTAAGLSAYHSTLAGLSPLGCHSNFPTPGSLSPNSLRQAYPRSLSPNSLLAASRFHPYKSPLAGLPPTAPLPGGLPSALGQYYSPYALYGARLGAAVAP